MLGGWREVEGRKNWSLKRSGRLKKGGKPVNSRGQKKMEAEKGWEAKKWLEPGEK